MRSATAAPGQREAFVLERRRMTGGARVGLVLAIAATGGLLVLLLGLAWLLDDAPARLERDGLRTRRGRTRLWIDVEDAQAQVEHRRAGGRLVPVRRFVRLTMRDGRRVHFEPALYANGEAGLAWLEHVLGRSFADASSAVREHAPA